MPPYPMTSTTSYFPPMREPGTMPMRGFTGAPPSPDGARSGLAPDRDHRRVVLASRRVRRVDHRAAERLGVVRVRDDGRGELLLADEAVGAVAREDVEVSGADVDAPHL